MGVDAQAKTYSEIITPQEMNSETNTLSISLFKTLGVGAIYK